MQGYVTGSYCIVAAAHLIVQGSKSKFNHITMQLSTPEAFNLTAKYHISVSSEHKGAFDSNNGTFHHLAHCISI